ncbi:MAG: Rne/Rng family ribonuclease [Opitutaceae bacterium]|nr:Rne/Rng family ribonuclease [Cytophagales bacterium]
MANELFINSSAKEDRIALVQDKRLVEFNVESKGNNFTVGDIYLGTIKKVIPGLNAAFVELGYEKDAFLHYLDLGPNIRSLMKYVKAVQGNDKTINNKLNGFKLEPETDKTGKMAQLFTKNNQILVQVVKEPISTKGPRLSCELSLAGRYIVLVPFSKSVSISKKIADKEERNRLIKLITSIKPENFGVIIRTVAQGKEVAELDKDMKSLLKKWDDGFNALKTAKSTDLIIGEIGRASSILRDLLNESFDNITVDSKELYEEIKGYIKTIAPDKEKILKHYTGKTKIFEHFGFEKQLKSLFGTTVSLPNGGYLIIEQTEALHVVDVNSGNKSTHEESQESTALSVNLDACKELARQFRLRDLGGIIVVDFIDMKNPDHRNQLFEKMRDEMVYDRSKYTILPLSKFGLMQITRQRVRQAVHVTNNENCPTCNGTGKISSSIAVTDIIENNIHHLITKQNEKKIVITMHPFVYSYYTKGLISKQMQWYLKYKKWVTLIPDTTLAMIEYKFLNDLGEEIELM